MILSAAGTFRRVVVWFMETNMMRKLTRLIAQQNNETPNENRDPKSPVTVREERINQRRVNVTKNLIELSLFMLSSSWYSAATRIGIGSFVSLFKKSWDASSTTSNQTFLSTFAPTTSSFPLGYGLLFLLASIVTIGLAAYILNPALQGCPLLFTVVVYCAMNVMMFYLMQILLNGFPPLISDLLESLAGLICIIIGLYILFIKNIAQESCSENSELLNNVLPNYQSVDQE
jgi:hypothetical protein